MTAIEVPQAQRYPPKIQQLKDSMAHAKALVEELTSRLISAQHEYDELQREWLQYQASIAPIRRCPSEVLLMIFKLYVVEDPLAIGQLLLVCKHWYELASTSPQLWTHIRVEFTDDWDVKSISETTYRYIDMCLQRSGSMLLEVGLDFRNLMSIHGQIIKEILDNLENFVSDNQGELISWATDLDTEAVDNGEVMSSFHLDYAFEVINKLVGENGGTMKRWKSLDLQFPLDDNELAQEVWDHFLYPTPNLTRMVLGEFRRYFPHHSGNVTPAFPDLSSLKHLDIYDAPDRQCFAPHGSSLQSLILRGGTESWTATSLASFTNLQTLELIGEYYEFQRPPSSPPILNLPELRQLTLRGDFSFSDMMEFVAPKLRMLNIVQEDSWCFPTLPNAQPPCVGWELDSYYERDREGLQHQLDEILTKYHTTERLVCPEDLSDLVIETLQRRKANGTLSSTLRTVAFKDEDEDVTDIWHVS